MTGLNKLLNKTTLIKFVLFFSVFTFLAILFAHDYNRYPYEGHADEQAFAWAGFSLLKDGSPTSWTHFEYPGENVVFEGAVGNKDELAIDVKLVNPWFDHAPVFALMSGAGPYLSGANEISVFDAALIRIPSVIAFWLTLIAIFILGRKLYGYWTGLFGMIVFGTVPLFVFGGRLALPEVIFALFFVLMMIAWTSYEKTSKLYLLVIIGLLGGLAGSMKYTGFLISPLFIYFLIKRGEYKNILYIVVAQIPFLLGLAYYANMLNLDLYMAMIARQGFRPIGWTGLPFLFGSPGFNIDRFYDGWFTMALLSVVVLAFVSKSKKDGNILWPAFYWMTLVILTGGQQDMLAWYRYPMYPFLAISLVLFLKEIIKKPTYFGALLVFGLLLSSRHYLSNAFRPDILPPPFRITFILLLFPVLLLGTKMLSKDFWKKITRVVLVSFIVFSVWINIRLIYNKYLIRCENLTCPLREGNVISELHMPVIWRFIAYREDI